MTPIDNLGYLGPILVHPVMRQMFANTVQLNWTPDLTPCRNNKTKFVFNCKIAVIWIEQRSFSGIAQILQILQFFHRQSVDAKRWWRAGSWISLSSLTSGHSVHPCPVDTIQRGTIFISHGLELCVQKICNSCVHQISETFHHFPYWTWIYDPLHHLKWRCDEIIWGKRLVRYIQTFWIRSMPDLYLLKSYDIFLRFIKIL